MIKELRSRVIDTKKMLESNKLIKSVVRENEAYIIDMNTTDQLYAQGVNSLGVSISDYAPYSPITIQIKRLKGQPTNRVTLRDTGDFYESFYIQYGNEAFEIKAKDEKTHDLIKKYGRKILGLTDENLNEIIQEYIYPDILTEVKKKIYGK